MNLFISYSRDDKNWVYELADELRDGGRHFVWIDTAQLVGGEDWWTSILAAIEQADCIIVILTRKSVGSLYCAAELDYALALNKPILPLMLKPIPPNELPDGLRKRNLQFENIETLSLERTLTRCEIAFGRFQLRIERKEFSPPSPPPLRPSVPTLSEKPTEQHLFEVFALAEENAANGKLEVAETLYQQIIRADPQGLGITATQRLSEIRHAQDRAKAYNSVIRLATNSTTRAGAMAAWQAYIAKYGADYDPSDLATKLAPRPILTPELPRQQQASLSPPSRPAPTGQSQRSAKRAGSRRSWGVLGIAITLLAPHLTLTPELPRQQQDSPSPPSRPAPTEQPQSAANRAGSRRSWGVLGVVITLVVVFGALISPRLFSASPTDKPTETAKPTFATSVPSQPINPSITPKPTLESTVTFNQSETLVPTVTANNQWTPVLATFDGVDMMLVPPGCFMMGSNDGENDEKPVHEVCITKAFYVDRFEVTNAQFAASGGKAGKPSQWADANRPRESISWEEANTYCHQRGGRLPTEAEWEYAARGPDGLKYPWGYEFIAANVVYRGNSNNITAMVGENMRLGGRSWVGAYDLSGSIAEWVFDWYGAYPSAKQLNPINQIKSLIRVLRGGSWLGEVTNLRSADRVGGTPDLVGNDLGFRCARSYE